MKRFTSAIRQSLTNKNWYAALFMAVAMPDICGKLSYPSAGVGERYRSWCLEYITKRYTHAVGPAREPTVFLSADDCYALRCAVLHSGMDELSDQQKHVLDRISFSTVSAHCNRFNINGVAVLCLNVSRFCEDIVEAVMEWQEQVKSNKDIQERIDKLVTIHEESYSPFPGVIYG